MVLNLEQVILVGKEAESPTSKCLSQQTHLLQVHQEYLAQLDKKNYKE